MGGYRDLTTEETYEVRGMLAKRCGLSATRINDEDIYLQQDGEEYCPVDFWQPEFDPEQALMVDAVLFVVSEVMMMRRDDGEGKQYKFSGVVASDKPYVRTEWEDSMSSAIFDAAVRMLQGEGAI